MIKKFDNTKGNAFLEKNFKRYAMHSIRNVTLPNFEYGKTYYGNIAEGVNVFRYEGTAIIDYGRFDSNMGVSYILYDPKGKKYLIPYEDMPEFFDNKKDFFEYVSNNKVDNSLLNKGNNSTLKMFDKIIKKYTHYITDNFVMLQEWSWDKSEGMPYSSDLCFDYMWCDINGLHIVFADYSAGNYITKKECIEDNFKLSEEFDDEEETIQTKSYEFKVKVLATSSENAKRALQIICEEIE